MSIIAKRPEIKVNPPCQSNPRVRYHMDGAVNTNEDFYLLEIVIEEL